MITNRRQERPRLGAPAAQTRSSHWGTDRQLSASSGLLCRTAAILQQMVRALFFGLLMVLAGCGGGGGGGGGGDIPTTASSPAIAAILLSFPSGHIPSGAVDATHNGYVSVFVGNQSTGAPISNATVTFNGANVPYVVADQAYDLDVSVNSGDNIALSVTVNGSTYSVTGTQAPSYPTISAPAENATWLNAAANIATWSGVVPTAQSMYMLGVTDTSGRLLWPASGSFLALSPGTTSYTIGAANLTTGSRLVMVGIASSVPIANAASGSGLITAAFDYAPITVTDTPPPALVSIAVTPANSSVGLTQTQQFTATGTYADNSTQDLTTQVTWQSSDTSKATISTTGLAHGVAYGPTTITASLGGVSNSTPLIVFQRNPSPALPLSQAVAYQIDYAHTGRASFGTSLSFPASPTWSVTLAGTASYPLIVDGTVFVIASAGPGNGTQLYALDEIDGHVVWGPIAIAGTYNWAALAYDHGKVFVINSDGLLRSFDALTGGLDWSVQMSGQTMFMSPPTAANGIVYLAGSGSAGTLYAVAEDTGSVLWTASVWNGGSSSPAVSTDGVFVSYPCQVYSFDPVSGKALWHYSGPCDGGGGETPVLAGDLLYVRDPGFNSPLGQTYDPATGARIGSFASTTIPAVSAQTAYLMNAGTLQAFDLASQSGLWSFVGDGQLVTAPVVVDDRVIVGSSSGTVFAVDAVSGAQVWSGIAGATIHGPYNGLLPTAAIGAGDGYIVVPADNVVTAWRISGP